MSAAGPGCLSESRFPKIYKTGITFQFPTDWDIMPVYPLMMILFTAALMLPKVAATTNSTIIGGTDPFEEFRNFEPGMVGGNQSKSLSNWSIYPEGQFWKCARSH